MTEARKGTSHTNAPIHVELHLDVGTLEGNIVTGNQIWRFEDATPTAEQEDIEAGPHLSIRTTSSANQYETTDTLTGFTDNFAEKPAWNGEPEDGEFGLDEDEIGFPEDMPFTVAQSKAWKPD